MLFYVFSLWFPLLTYFFKLVHYIFYNSYYSQEITSFITSLIPLDEYSIQYIMFNLLTALNAYFIINVLQLLEDDVAKDKEDEGPSLVAGSWWIFALLLTMLKLIVSPIALDREFPSSRPGSAARRRLFLSGTAEPRAFLGDSVWWRDSCVSDESAWGQRANVLGLSDWL